MLQIMLNAAVEIRFIDLLLSHEYNFLALSSHLHKRTNLPHHRFRHYDGIIIGEDKDEVSLETAI
jgi:hypothetical protein